MTSKSTNIMVQNERGSALMGILVATAILIIAISVLLTGQKSALQEATATNLRVSAANLKSNIAAYIRNDSSWAKIKSRTENSTSFGCVAGGNCDTEEKPIPVIVDAAGVTVIDTTSGGFNMAGKPCTPASTGDQNCPFRLAVSWKTQCTTPCAPTMITVTATVLYAGKMKMAFNQENYQIEVVRIP